MPSIYAQGPKLLMATLLVLKQDGLAVSGRGLVWHFNDLLHCQKAVAMQCLAWLLCKAQGASVHPDYMRLEGSVLVQKWGSLCAQLRLSLALD